MKKEFLMTNLTNQLNGITVTEMNEGQPNYPEWDELIVCRVEVDLPTWISNLAGGGKWEVYAEDESDHCISFAMREESKNTAKKLPKLAEVTLYHNGHAVVDVEGSLFDGSLTNGSMNFANLTYYHADSGEKITLN
jgi:hypothetical protein